MPNGRGASDGWYERRTSGSTRWASGPWAPGNHPGAGGWFPSDSAPSGRRVRASRPRPMPFSPDSPTPAVATSAPPPQPRSPQRALTPLAPQIPLTPPTPPTRSPRKARHLPHRRVEGPLVNAGRNWIGRNWPSSCGGRPSLRETSPRGPSYWSSGGRSWAEVWWDAPGFDWRFPRHRRVAFKPSWKPRLPCAAPTAERPGTALSPSPSQ